MVLGVGDELGGADLLEKRLELVINVAVGDELKRLLLRFPRLLLKG
jgi:hypothetical protein